MKSALLSTAARSVPAGGPTFYLDADEKEGGEDKRMDALMDMIRDACMKMDEGGQRMDARMDAVEKKFAEIDSARKDAEEKAEKEKAEADRKDSEGETEEEKKERADKARKDEDEMDRKDAEEKEEKERADKARKDAEEEGAKKKETAEADAVSATRAELESIRAEIAALNKRAPQIVSDSDRERFASIQETAEPVFQAFGDRAPAPLEGETPTQYKRRLGAKMQGHSPRWKESRLSAIGDEASLDVVLDQIYADATSVARRGADVPEGNLRANRTTTEAGHTRISYSGDTGVFTNMFSGHLQRA